MPYELLTGDALTVLQTLESESVHCCVTSPPYFGLRCYGVSGQLGSESTLAEYIANQVAVFGQVRRVLCNDGTLWLNMGDTYAHNGACGGGSPLDCPTDGKPPRTPKGRSTDKDRQQGMRYRTPQGLKPKDLCGVPWRLAFALQADGWWLRSDIIWHKPSPIPESVRDRPTKAHEYLFLLAKSERYFYDADAVREPYSKKARLVRDRASNFKKQGQVGNHLQGDPVIRLNPLGRNRRSVWTIATKPFKGAHFATFPPALVEPCILAGCPIGGTVLDPFSGAGTTGLVALKHGRDYLGIELNPSYQAMAKERLDAVASA